MSAARDRGAWRSPRSRCWRLPPFVALFQPFAGDGGDPVRVAVPKAAGVSDIADLLEQRGVVSSATLFEVRATLAGDRGRPEARDRTSCARTCPTATCSTA